MAQQAVSDSNAAGGADPNTSVEGLGKYIDGWADLIQNQGGKAARARAEVVSILRTRYPEKQVEVVKGTVIVGKSRSPARPYALTRTHPGATTTIFIGERGQDLYVSWRAFRRPVFSNLIYFVIGAALLLTLFLMREIGNLALGLAAAVIIGGALYWLLGKYSEVVYGDPMAVFYIQVNLFDKEDTVATNLSVHKSLLQALDKVGIDASSLRLKQNFNAGAHDEVI